jgi:adenylylsulfate kinase
MTKRILIMGLPGSGKTHLALALSKLLHPCTWFNADVIRESFDDWDFSNTGRLRQAKRMKDLANNSEYEYAICDFVCPTEELRTMFNADYTVWVNTIESGRFEDTNTVFVPPLKCNIVVTEKDAEKWAEIIFRDLMK